MINIGFDENTAVEEYIIDIRDKDQIIKARYALNDKDIEKSVLMSERYISISFVLDRFVSFVRSDYIIWAGEKYLIKEDYIADEVNKFNYKYTLRFDHWTTFLHDDTFYYTNQDLEEADWSLMSNAATHFQFIADNANRYFGVNTFNVGTIEFTELKLLQFSKASIWDAATQIAEAYGGEWYLTGTTFHLVKKFSYGSEIDFETEVSVEKMDRSEGENSEKYTRILALGSTRNIPANYRETTPGEAVDAIYQKRLRIPASKGKFIDAKPNMSPEQVKSAVVIFEEVYPKRIGTMSSVSTVEYTDTNTDTGVVTTWNAYRFKDTGLQFKEEYILPGVELRIAIQSGNINGMDFAVKFNPLGKPETDPDSQIFEIIRNEDYGKALPNDILKPQNGDTYVLYGFNIQLVSDQYVPAGEQELFDKATEWLAENNRDKSVFDCPTIIQHFADNEMNLEIGQKVRLVRGMGANRNLLPNTNQGISGWGSFLQNGTVTRTEVEALGVRACKLTTTVLSTGYHVLYHSINRPLIKNNTQYTLSVDVFCEFATYATFRLIALNAVNSLATFGTKAIPANTWTRVELTATTNDNTGTNQYIYITDFNKLGAVTFANLKLEEGNKATSWSPAPEDIPGAISLSRIQGYEKRLLNKYQAIYTVGDNAAYSRLSEIEESIKELQIAGNTYQATGKNGVYLITQFDNTPPSDFNAYSAKASDARYLNKQTGGTVQGDTAFQKKVKAKEVISDQFGNETFTSGQFGSGFRAWLAANGQSYAEFDNLMVRREMIINTLTIAEIKSVGGQILLSLANMYCNGVTDGGTYWKCTFDTANGTISNLFAVDDQVICRKFNGSNIKYYWARVTSVGTDYINISKTDKDGSGIPAINDEIIQFGNRTNTARQSAIMLSAYGSDAPSIKQYAGINSYNLTGKEVTVISPSGNKFTGDFVIQSSGTNVTTAIDNAQSAAISTAATDATNKVSAIQIGGSNLLNGSSFEKGSGQSTVVNGSTISRVTGGYDGTYCMQTVSSDNASSGYCWGSLPTIAGKEYVISCYVKADTPIAGCSFNIANSGWQSVKGKSIDIGTEWTRVDLNFMATGTLMRMIILKSSVTFYVDCIQLEEGNKVTTWKLSQSDIQADITAANTAATNAATAASNAQTSANTANSLLADIANDNLLIPSEKQDVLKEWQIIQGEYPAVVAQATTYSVSSSDYTTKYNALSSYITPLLSNMTANSTIVATTFRNNFKAYYDAKITLLKLVTDKAKTIADAAQTTANTAVSNAATAQTAATNAQTTADIAVSNAATANALVSDIANDNKFTSNEKSPVRQEWNVIASELSVNNTQADTFGITTEKTAYNSAFQALANYLNNGTIWSTGVPSWIADANLSATTTITGSTFRANWKAYYDTRTVLLNAIAKKAKQLADAAQSSADTANAGLLTKVAYSEYNAQMQILNNQISSKVSQTDFNVLGQRVSDTESSITQQAGQISSVVTQVNTAQTDASNAATAASNANTNAQNAQTTANSKNRTYYQDAQPTAPSGGFVVGDIWQKVTLTDISGNINSDSTKNVCRLEYRWNGTTWVQINFNVSGSYVTQTNDSITSIVTKTGINSLGTGETLKSLIDQTPGKIELAVSAIQIG